MARSGGVDVEIRYHAGMNCLALLRRLGRLYRVLTWLALLAFGVASGAEIPSIAAAADLRYALDEVVLAYQHTNGVVARVTYGSSGNFFTQLQQGAPFDIFMSADETLVQALAARSLTRDAGELYAIGRIVLFAPRGGPIMIDKGFTDLRRALDDGRLSKFAIANPAHAPYGRAAREALRAAGLWERLAAHLVLGENVAQAAQFARSGAAQAGIFALSLALAPPFADAGTYVVIDPSQHQPLRQRMVLMRGAGEAATQLYAYLKSPVARAVLRRYGFTLPHE